MNFIHAHLTKQNKKLRIRMAVWVNKRKGEKIKHNPVVGYIYLDVIVLFIVSRRETEIMIVWDETFF